MRDFVCNRLGDKCFRLLNIMCLSHILSSAIVAQKHYLWYVKPLRKKRTCFSGGPMMVFLFLGVISRWEKEHCHIEWPRSNPFISLHSDFLLCQMYMVTCWRFFAEYKALCQQQLSLVEYGELTWVKVSIRRDKFSALLEIQWVSSELLTTSCHASSPGFAHLGLSASKVRVPVTVSRSVV